jgi:hypothetical protein
MTYIKHENYSSVKGNTILHIEDLVQAHEIHRFFTFLEIN